MDFGHGAFAPGQVYVALSRCRSRDYLSHVLPIHETHVICDPRIKRFYTAIKGAGRSLAAACGNPAGTAAGTIIAAKDTGISSPDRSEKLVYIVGVVGHLADRMSASQSRASAG